MLLGLKQRVESRRGAEYRENLLREALTELHTGEPAGNVTRGFVEPSADSLPDLVTMAARPGLRPAHH